MRAIRWFFIGLCFPVSFFATDLLIKGKNVNLAVYAVPLSLPCAIVFSLLALAWDLLDDPLPRADTTPEEPTVAPPPRPPRRGRSRRKGPPFFD